ncbi:alpha/beta hydrolase [Salinirubellus salinus]|uniref:Alpha/beta hydrolase n=1 Tax=Salinirubellus salinus TaxID=1364945 RepID=A0A9E7U345_9EURY|nr:alpha/beta hydrolase [Salinirubellus salinus]UWM52845.1 alpha/beta hydrolase [Salinirubellus salinus]
MQSSTTAEEWTHDETTLSEVTLHHVTAGPEDGDLVVLFHGFPECWYAWRHQIPALADAGYRVVAPDLRGYGTSSRPERVGAYGLDHLSRDVRDLVEAFDRQSAHVVGHDWGGVVATATALYHPAVVDRLVVLNAPYPTNVTDQFSIRQALRSSYAAFFQLPSVPERLFRARDFALLERAFEDAAPGAYTESELAVYREAWSQPGALTAMLDYYRAFGRDTVRDLLGRDSAWTAGRRVNAPTLLLWGEKDRALGPEVREAFERAVPDCQTERYPTATHWLHAEFPDRVTGDLREFLD